MRVFAKYALYALLFYLVFCFQAAFAPLFAPLGASPELLPVLLGSVCALEAPLPAAFLGLFAGILRDTLSASRVYYSLVYYLSSLSAAYLIRRQLRPCAALSLFSACALCLLADAQLFLAALLLPGTGLLPALKSAGLHLGFTLLFFPPLYALCSLICRIAPRPEHAGKQLPSSRIKSYVSRKGGRARETQ